MVAPLLALLAFAPTGGGADALLELLDRLREEAGLSRLAEAPELSTLAAGRAADLAEAPPGHRLPHPVPLDEAFEDLPEWKGRRVTERVVLVAPGASPHDRLAAAWDGPREDAAIFDADLAAAGLGSAVADDGQWVLVVLLAHADARTPRETIERFVLDEINAVRVEHELPSLSEDPALREVARRHSEELLGRGALSHASSDGSMPFDRAKAASIEFVRVGENVARSDGSLGAIHSVVRDWMESPGHRRNILTYRFTASGVGVAIADDGTLWITQMFVER